MASQALAGLALAVQAPLVSAVMTAAGTASALPSGVATRRAALALAVVSVVLTTSWLTASLGQAALALLAQQELPALISTAAGNAVAAPLTPRVVATTARILLVEDEDGVRRVVHRLLQRAGYTVQQARFGSEALALVADPAFTVDLLLSDVYMPGMNGVQLAAQLRAQRPGLRVLFMSGHVDDRADLKQIQANGDVIVDKPFTTDALLRHVESTLASRPA